MLVTQNPKRAFSRYDLKIGGKRTFTLRTQAGRIVVAARNHRARAHATLLHGDGGADFGSWVPGCQAVRM